MNPDFTLNLNKGTLEPHCRICGLLVCSCSDQKRTPQFDSERLEINKAAIRKSKEQSLTNHPRHNNTDRLS